MVEAAAVGALHLLTDGLSQHELAGKDTHRAKAAKRQQRGVSGSLGSNAALLDKEAWM
jgi:hypothetical protein